MVKQSVEDAMRGQIVIMQGAYKIHLRNLNKQGNKIGTPMTLLLTCS